MPQVAESNNHDRIQFEKWYLSQNPQNFNHMHTLEDIQKLRAGDGYWAEHCFSDLESKWTTWLASRAAMKTIEPEPVALLDNDTPSELIRKRLSQLVADAYKAACPIDVGPERTEAFALYTVLHRLQRRGAAIEIHDATNPLIDYVPRPSVQLPPSHNIDVRGDGPIRVWSTVAVYRADEIEAMLLNAKIEVVK